MRDVVIDTDTASLLQRRQAPPWVLRQLADARIWLTFITVGELANWAVLRQWDEGRSRRLDAWTARRPVIPYDARIAGLWGELAGQAQLRGRPRPQSHTWIAACCLRYQVPLVALDPGGFGDFAEHHGLVLLGDSSAAKTSLRCSRTSIQNCRRPAPSRSSATVITPTCTCVCGSQAGLLSRQLDHDAVRLAGGDAPDVSPVPGARDVHPGACGDIERRS